MGWDSAYHWTKKSTVVNETAASLQKNGYAILAQKSTAAGVWFVLEKEEKREIFLALIKKQGNEFYRKDLTESAGPSYYCCPVSFFELVPCPGQYATEWREKVKELQTKKARVLSPGMIIDVYGKTYEVMEKREKSWRVKEVASGTVYKMGPKHLTQWREVSKLEAHLTGVSIEG